MLPFVALDGKPLEASSRITTFFNFGYVALTIKSITIHDRGVYACVARNALGEATTQAQLTVVTKKDVLLDTQHPQGLEKIRYLEDDSRYARSVQVIHCSFVTPYLLPRGSMSCEFRVGMIMSDQPLRLFLLFLYFILLFLV